MYDNKPSLDSLQHRLERMLQVMEFGGQVDYKKFETLLLQVQQTKSKPFKLGDNSADNL